MAGIQTEIWVSDIAENLFPNNEAILQSVDDSVYLDNKTLNLPQSGSSPNVVVNRSTFPATASQRTDSVRSYSIDEFSTDPIHLQHTEALELSYDKRASLLRDHVQVLGTKITDYGLQKWGVEGSDFIVRTSGANRPAATTGQTGTRKRLTKQDILEAKRKMDRMDVPKNGRVLLLNSDMMTDLLSDQELANLLSNPVSNLKEGVIGRLFGFDVMERSTVLMYNNATTPVKKALGAVVASTDNSASLAWHPSMVRRCVGTATNGGIVVFYQDQNPAYYGDVMSALIRAGFDRWRSDSVGVISIVESAGA